MRNKSSGSHNSSHNQDRHASKFSSAHKVTEKINRDKKIKFSLMFVIYLAILVVLFISFIKTSYASSSSSGCGDSCSSCDSCGCSSDASTDDNNDDSEDDTGSDNSGVDDSPSCTTDISVSMSQSNDYTEVSYVISSCTNTTFNLWLERDTSDSRSSQYIYQNKRITSSQKLSGSGKQPKSANFIEICYQASGGVQCCSSDGSSTCSS